MDRSVGRCRRIPDEGQVSRPGPGGERREPGRPVMGLVASNRVVPGGGEASFLGAVGSALDALGCDTVLFNPGAPVSSFRDARVVNLNKSIGAHTIAERLREPIKRAVTALPPVYPFAVNGYLLSTARRMALLLESAQRCDAYLAIGRVGPAACALAGVNYGAICVSMHHRTYEHVFAARRVPRWLAARPLRSIARLELEGYKGAVVQAANSLDLKQYLVEFAGIVDCHLLWAPVVAPDTLPSREEARRRLGLGARAPVVATVGRMDATKGMDVLIRAMALVQAARGDASLVLAGSGREEGRFRALARELGLNARFLGQRSDVFNLYRASDVVVMLFPTLGGASMAMLEAMSAGAAVITNRIRGLDTIKFDGQAELVDERSHRDVADGILRLLSDDSLRHAIGERASRYVREVHTGAGFAAEISTMLNSLGVTEVST